MRGFNLLSVLVSAILSGLLGVIISNWYHNKNEIKREKIKVLQQLIGNRYDLKGEKFTEALNQIFVIFYDSPEVLNALKEFYEVVIGGWRSSSSPSVTSLGSPQPDVSTRPSHELVNQKLLDLFKTMCKHLNIKIEPLTDNFFLTPFNVRALTYNLS